MGRNGNTDLRRVGHGGTARRQKVQAQQLDSKYTGPFHLSQDSCRSESQCTWCEGYWRSTNKQHTLSRSSWIVSRPGPACDARAPVPTAPTLMGVSCPGDRMGAAVQPTDSGSWNFFFVLSKWTVEEEFNQNAAVIGHVLYKETHGLFKQAPTPAIFLSFCLPLPLPLPPFIPSRHIEI